LQTLASKNKFLKLVKIFLIEQNNDILQELVVKISKNDQLKQAFSEFFLKHYEGLFILSDTLSSVITLALWVCFCHYLGYCFITDTLIVFVFNTFNERYIAAQKELNNNICTLQEAINSNDVCIRNYESSK